MSVTCASCGVEIPSSSVDFRGPFRCPGCGEQVAVKRRGGVYLMPLAAISAALAYALGFRGGACLWCAVILYFALIVPYAGLTSRLFPQKARPYAQEGRYLDLSGPR